MKALDKIGGCTGWERIGDEYVLSRQHINSHSDASYNMKTLQLIDRIEKLSEEITVKKTGEGLSFPATERSKEIIRGSTVYCELVEQAQRSH